MEGWQYKIWSNDTTIGYLSLFPEMKIDNWTLPLKEWIFHSLAEAILLYGAITGKTSKCSDALMWVNETEEMYKTAIKHIQDEYANKYKNFALFRLNLKINDLLTLENEFPRLIGDDYECWETALDVLFKEVKDSGLYDDNDFIINNEAKYYS